MDTGEIIAKVRKIEIKTKKMVDELTGGAYHSVFKGRGIEFSEVREYTLDDDVRDIDWNVTARLNKPYIKVFEEERELTVMLLVDVSGSRNFGTLSQMKRDMMAEVAATLAFSTIANNDKVGVIFFSDKIEKFIPAQKGKTHVLHIIRELLSFEPSSSGTDIAQALQYFANAQKRHCTAFLISDFIGAGAMYKPLLIASNRHEVNAIQIYDRREAELPNVGLVKFHDAETGNDLWVDTAIASVRNDYAQAWRDNQNEIQQLFTRTGVNNISIRTDEDYVKALMHLFRC
jgi:uncharacterized protein (DUF58 family)